MTITIKKVTTKKELKKFIRFNYELYKNNPYSVPDLYDDMLNTFNPEKNPAFEFCEAEYFLAYKGEEIVGRVAAIINHRANDTWNKKEVRFGWLDFIDEEEVSSALLKAVEQWGKEKGMEAIVGPLGFTDMDAEGMLVEGFDQLSTMATIYNYSYYPEHMEQLGFEKEADWVEYKLSVPHQLPEKFVRISEIILQKYNLKIKKLKRSEIKKQNYGQKIFDLINEAYAPLYGYSQMTQGQIDQYINMYLPLIDLRMVSLVEDAEGNLVAVGIAMPSLSKALQKAKGKMLPFGWYHLLKALFIKRPRVLDLLLVGVKPEYQSKGVNALLFYDLVPIFQQMGFEYGGRGKGDGLAFTLIPEEPIIAFRKFHFNEDHNWIYLHKNMRVYANVDMWDDEGMGFRVHSVQGDTVSLQNIDVEIRRIRLDEITSVLPYFPEITGLFSAEAHYIQTEKDLQLSAEASIDELTYERQRIGDITLGATWLPGEQGKQYLNAYLNHDKVEVLIADGKLLPTSTGKDSLEVNTTLEHFPLRIANAFIPDELVTLAGDMDGDLNITGSTEQPLINGELILDSVSVLSRQYGANFLFDNRPVQLKNNRLIFDKFAIYTTGKNPFTIDGYVDFRDMSRPMASLNLLAENYTLLNAKRTRESLVYGKVFADLRATIKGPLDGLNMRGNLNLLGNTDVSYVLTDSPLTVQDRLGSLVTFTSFSDTTTVVRQEVPTVSLGGLDMLMMVHIDPSVRVKVDLDASDNRIELEGGGDLSMKYTPQGDLTLTGRYTLSGGLMKYSLPIIAVKEFAIDNGSYVDWTGNPMDPMLNFKATDRIRASVSEGENGGTRMVNFDVSIVVKNRLDNLSFAFDVAAPEDATIQNELTAMGAEERGKQALYIMLMKTYLGTGPIGGGGGGLGKLNMGSALNSVLSSQINSLMGNLKNASVSVGVEDHDASDTGGKRTDYSFRYSQRLFNNRFQIVIGGKVSTGENATNDAESFIDNISLEYRLDRTGTRYVRLFYDKNYESVLEGEITETGVGLVLRKKLDKLSELFIFKKKK